MSNVGNLIQRSRERTLCINILVITNILGLIFGLTVYREFFVVQLQRLTLWECIHLWFNDIVTLLLFIIFCLRHYFSTGSSTNYSLNTGDAKTIWWLSIVILISAMGVDLWSSWTIKQSILVSYDNSIPLKGNIVEAHDYGSSGVSKINFTYVDQNNVLYETYYTLRANQRMQLPINIQQGLALKQFPLPIDLKFDPTHPERVWLADLGFDGMIESIVVFSTINLTFQGIIALLYINAGIKLSQQSIVPWWHDMHGVMMLSVVSILLIVVGLRLLFSDEPIAFDAFSR